MNLLNEKQLRYLARAIQEDINGLNPYERKNIFKIGKSKTCNYIVKGTQFAAENRELFSKIDWHSNSVTPYLEKEGCNINFYFRQDNFKNTDKVLIKKSMTSSDIYLLISELQDTINQ